MNASVPDCVALAASFPTANFDPVNCCMDPLVHCNPTTNRIKSVNMACSTGGQPWIGTTFPSQLAALTSLEQLYFTDCGMIGPLPDIFDSFSALFELHLGYPPVTWNWMGPQFPNAGNGNNFEGLLPGSLGRMTSLYFLHVEGNRFTGSVPQGLVDYIINGETLKNGCQSGTNECYFFFDNNCLTGVPVVDLTLTGVFASGHDTQRPDPECPPINILQTPPQDTSSASQATSTPPVFLPVSLTFIAPSTVNATDILTLQASATTTLPIGVDMSTRSEAATLTATITDSAVSSSDAVISSVFTTSGMTSVLAATTTSVLPVNSVAVENTITQTIATTSIQTISSDSVASVTVTLKVSATASVESPSSTIPPVPVFVTTDSVTPTFSPSSASIAPTPGPVSVPTSSDAPVPVFVTAASNSPTLAPTVAPSATIVLVPTSTDAPVPVFVTMASDPATIAPPAPSTSASEAPVSVPAEEGATTTSTAFVFVPPPIVEINTSFLATDGPAPAPQSDVTGVVSGPTPVPTFAAVAPSALSAALRVYVSLFACVLALAF